MVEHFVIVFNHVGFFIDSVAEKQQRQSSRTIRDVLEQALATEKSVIADYGKRISQADTVGDFSRKIRLKNQV